jgi:ABC-type multidrug transport system ATPase subunit
MALLEVDQLSKAYEKVIAVDGASFSIHEGEIFGFLGPNGAGKTTTINMLTGLARAGCGLDSDSEHRLHRKSQGGPAFNRSGSG